MLRNLRFEANLTLAIVLKRAKTLLFASISRLTLIVQIGEGVCFRRNSVWVEPVLEEATNLVLPYSSELLWNVIKSLCRQAGRRQCGCVLSWHANKKVWPTQATGLTCKPVTVCTNKAGVIRLIRSSPAGFLTWPVKLPLPLPDQHFRRNIIWSVGGNLWETFLNMVWWLKWPRVYHTAMSIEILFSTISRKLMVSPDLQFYVCAQKGPSAQGANLTNEVDLVSVATFAKGWRRRRSKKGPYFAEILFELDIF